MSSVLPINTQRYESGDYTLEVTVHPSALSQWSDRPVVRQLRFSLWTNQPTRQRLVTGDQQQLLTLSNTVEAYVQRHLTHAAWPRTHRLQLLNQAVDLSTLQLFGLAEVLSAYGQRQITLPTAPKVKRRRSRWWVGSAVASLLVSVGVATVYWQERPVVNDVVTSQAPEAIFEDDVAATVPSTVPIPEANEAPDSGSVPATPSVSSGDSTNFDDRPGFRASQELAQRPSESPDAAVGASGAAAVEPQVSNEELAPSLDVAKVPERSAETLPETLSTDSFEQGSDSELAAAAPAEPPPAVIAPTPETAIQPEQEEALDDSRVSSDLEPAMTRSSMPDDGLSTRGAGSILDAIATHFAPYQPTNSPYPLVYRLQIGSDGTILKLEPITENAPTIQAEALTSPPGRLLQLELTYTGAGRPTVRELP
ncbi:MAG: hypothetical protein AAFU84_01885 [Cyanobacteria bacterium J06633_23]